MLSLKFKEFFPVKRFDELNLLIQLKQLRTVKTIIFLPSRVPFFPKKKINEILAAFSIPFLSPSETCSILGNPVRIYRTHRTDSIKRIGKVLSC